MRSAGNVLAEMEQVKRDFGIEEVMFEDDNLTLNSQRAEDIFDKMIEGRLGIKWDTPNGIAAWTLNERIIYKMKESGCYQLNFAVESGNQHVLDNIIRKPIDLNRVKSLIKYAKGIGLDVGIFLVIGMPGETKEQIWDSFRLLRELEINSWNISVATPYPGSRLLEICKEKGYLKDDFNLNDLHIRSFPISTEDWDGQGLRQILRQGESFLFFSYILRHPLRSIKSFIVKIFTNPCGALKKLIFVLTALRKKGNLCVR